MKPSTFVLLLCFCFVHCRKTLPINKHANTAFINMESGGLLPAPNSQPTNQPKTPPIAPAPAPVPTPQPAQFAPTTFKPNVNKVPIPSSPVTNPPQQIKPKPVNPSPVVNPITTPGPGTVKQLVNFYDSQGKASPIRPYSYSQAVKQG